MDYRGQDLDLRTARWSAASTEPSSWREATPQPAQSVPAARPAASRTSPIWVDETLLACANQAFDVALAYRSAEVRLEHLLLAMTRVEAAATALEARGVRVVSLRRDSAVTIAGEMPVTNADGAASPRRSPELEDVLRLAASRAAHINRAASIDDVVQVLGDVGGDLPGAELIVRHFPRVTRDFWSTPGVSRGAQGGGSHPIDGTDVERSPIPASLSLTPVAQATLEPAIVQRLFDRLADLERGFADRLSALELAMARQPHTLHADLSPIDGRLAAIENTLQLRPMGEGIAAIDPALSDRLWAIEHALGTERAERASAITALSDEITGVRSAVRLAAQNSEQTQGSLVEQVQQLAEGLEQHRRDLTASVGERIASVEQALDAQGQRTNEAHAVYNAELSEVHDALMKISANQHTLAGAIDNWRNNDSGEIHLINTRIGAVHEDGARRLAAIEKLCADVETLSQLVLDDRGERPRSGLKQWLYGTEDWIKASWRPSPVRSPPIRLPRFTWRLPMRRRSG
ncbi:MAG: Clp protease N-terminal domain-containing protein [Hyphomicrobium sp.]